MEKRLETLIKLLKNDPDDTFTLYAIALEYISLKEHESAIKYLRMVIKHDEKYIAAYQQLGYVHSITNKKNEAAETYEKGFEIAKLTGDKHAADTFARFLIELK
jgi:tetratricopeptide (TPR) repeat protein